MRRSSCLLHPGVDDRAPARCGPDEEAPDLLERALGGAQADPLERSPSRPWSVRAHVSLEALEREREVRAALGVRDGVDLVDDHRLDAAEHLARAAR